MPLNKYLDSTEEVVAIQRSNRYLNPVITNYYFIYVICGEVVYSLRNKDITKLVLHTVERVADSIKICSTVHGDLSVPFPGTAA